MRQRIPRPALEQYVSTIESRFIELSVVPLLPELVPDFWLDPFLMAPTKGALQAARDVEEAAVAVYPRLPKNSLQILEKAWSFLRVPEGVVQ